MKKTEIGTKAKRKFGDKEIVEVKDLTSEHIVLQDSNGRHFVKIKDFNKEFFDFMERVVLMDIE